MDLIQMVDMLQRGGGTAALVLLVIGGMRGDYIWRKHHEEALAVKDAQIAASEEACAQRCNELIDDRNWWRGQAASATEVSKHGVEIAERSTRRRTS